MDVFAILLILEVALLSANIALALSIKRDIRKRMEAAQREYDEFCAWYDSLTEEERKVLISECESEDSAEKSDSDGDSR